MYPNVYYNPNLWTNSFILPATKLKPGNKGLKQILKLMNDSDSEQYSYDPLPDLYTINNADWNKIQSNSLFEKKVVQLLNALINKENNTDLGHSFNYSYYNTEPLLLNLLFVLQNKYNTITNKKSSLAITLASLLKILAKIFDATIYSIITDLTSKYTTSSSQRDESLYAFFYILKYLLLKLQAAKDPALTATIAKLQEILHQTETTCSKIPSLTYCNK
ncbi:MAG: hypothetical protein RLZ12_535 [Bacillota bacterium]